MAFVRVAQCRRREVFVIPCEHRLPEATPTAIVSSGSSGGIAGITADAASSGESTSTQNRNRGVLRDQLPGGWAGTLCQPPGQVLIYG
jgi:hypothetical protein